MLYRQVWATVLLAVMAVSAVNAQETETEWTDWNSMNPDSFLIDIDEMDNRCHQGAALSSTTTEECNEAKDMLQAGQCTYLPIPDGIRYEFLLGLQAGKPHVYPKKIKNLGTSRMAYSCTVSTGRVIDWYAGEDGTSCGNVAARPLLLQANPLPSAIPVEDKPTAGFVCRNIPKHRHEGSQISFVSGVDAGDLCGESHFVPAYLYQAAELEVFGQSTRCLENFDDTFK